ncbi:alpha/beta hydrolase family protein [Haloterrigena alkaliphila]|uniref:Alpha/beta fold hydrolase n=1 Tax=Haloterrigena alkaliphila TaxID=2816475 RepID=A0A8A2V8T6_9EURY|nr:alpha/beta fold hydrolase [Haloterrigena alkaliphila]QSW98409.1 alpha/beta fold hydrolase [Haloterrigena alkaliphila]
MTALDRRQLLAAISTTTAAALAGCSDALDGESELDGNETDPSEDGTDSAPDTPAELATAFAEKLAAERFEAASELTSVPHVGSIPAGNLEQFWMGYTSAHGAFEELTGVEETDDLDTRQARTFGDATVFRIGLAFENGQDGLLAGIDVDVTAVDFAGEYERPSYVDPDAFTAESVPVSGEGCHLEGTAAVPTEPAAGDDVPGVVLVHGSGAADENYDNGGTQLFRDLAEGLASRGIAVLRYDKRTYRCNVDFADHTLDRVTVDDALVAIDELRGVDGVDADRIAVVGHSMGGMAAPRIADRDGDLAGAVSLAGNARPMIDLVPDQLEYQSNLGEHEWEQLDRRVEQIRTQVERVRNGEYEAGELVAMYPGALWQSLEEYDPFETARTTDVPLCFLQGSRDYQVTLENDFELWREELGDRSATAFESYDGINHLFMPGRRPSNPNEYRARNNVAEAVIDDLADWIDGR